MSTDYSKLSDFEIDKAVADALGINYDIAIMFVNPVDKINGKHVEEYVRKKITSNEKHWKRFAPTRIPNDAYSIILANKINIRFGADGFCHEAQFIQYGKESVEAYHENPLRAAMIVFLKMQESKSAS